MISVDLCLIVAGRHRESRDYRWENKSMAGLARLSEESLGERG